MCDDCFRRTQPFFKFHAEDHGFCRVYYRGRNGALYCYQDDGSWGGHDWKFYMCSRDGEPSHETKPVGGPIPLPPGHTRTGRDLIEFLKAQAQTDA